MEKIIIQKAFIIAMMVIALWCCFLPGMIFGKINYLRIRNYIKSPLYECPVCMSAWYGSVIYWFCFAGSWHEWLIVIPVSMGMITFFVKIKKD